MAKDKINKVKILTDSCSDLTLEIREKYDIDYMKMNTVYQGVEKSADLDWKVEDVKSFYDIMRKGDRITTTQVPTDEFERVFTKYAKDGYDIVYIGCTLKCSGSVNTGTVVAKKVMEQYPNVHIYCIDSLSASCGEGLVTILATKYRDEGLDAESIYNKVIENRNRINMFVTVHNLDGLKRCGRVKASSAFFGNLLGVKPILISDVDGNITPIKKVKGRNTSIAELVSCTKGSIEDAEGQTILVFHSDCDEDVQNLVNMIKSEVQCKDVAVGYIGPIIGASIGPGALAVACIGKEVTYGVERNGNK